MPRRWRVWAWIAGLVAATLLAYVVAGPFLTIQAIRDAVVANDSAALSKQVDFPALRASLKRQVSDRLIREAGTDVQSSVFGSVGLGIANAFAGTAVDAAVNPVGLATLMQGRSFVQRFSGAPAPATDAEGRRVEPLHDPDWRYESASRFTATVVDDAGEPVLFVFTRKGLRWKLSDIRLPPG